VFVGFLGWCRTRELARGSLEHLDAYLFLYEFNLNCKLAFVIFKVTKFLVAQALYLCAKA
jgi:hypothetical protein